MADGQNIANKETSTNSGAGEAVSGGIEHDTHISQLESLETEIRRIAPSTNSEPAAHEQWQNAEHVASVAEGVKNATSAGGLGAALADAQNAASLAYSEKKQEEYRVKLTRTLRDQAYAASVIAAASYGGIEVLAPAMSAEAAREFATVFIHGIGGLQEQHEDMMAD